MLLESTDEDEPKVTLQHLGDCMTLKKKIYFLLRYMQRFTQKSAEPSNSSK